MCSLSKLFILFHRRSKILHKTLSPHRTLMDKRRRKQANTTATASSEEVSSIEWEFVKMTDQEEDLINRMYRLVGDRWDLIAGRVFGRKAEEIERFWIMKHGRNFAEKRSDRTSRNS